MKHPAWREAYGLVRECIMDDSGLVILLGDRGTGKTQLAVEMVRDNCKRVKPCLYIKAAEIFSTIRRAFRDDGGITEEKAIASFVYPHLLVIDEAQERRHNDFENTHLTLILDKRYDECKPTIIIANESPAEFRIQIGESVWDRMHETGFVHECKWASFRVRRHAGNQNATG